MVDVRELSAVPRNRAGTGGARAVRRDGLVPAIIYGDGRDTTMIALENKALTTEIGKPGFFTRLFDIAIDGEKQRVLPRDLQRHPVSDKPLHVDFLRISATTRVTVEVPVVFENAEVSPGIKRGGVLNVVRHEVEVHCRADAIPQSFAIDLGGLEIGDSVHASTIALPEGVSFTIIDRDFTIATVAAPTVVREEEEAAAAAAGEGGEKPAGEAGDGKPREGG